MCVWLCVLNTCDGELMVIYIYILLAIATQDGAGSSILDGMSVNPDLKNLMDRAGPISETDWPTCLACGLIDRQRIRNQQTRSVQCETCFEKFCA